MCNTYQRYLGPTTKRVVRLRIYCRNGSIRLFGLHGQVLFLNCEPVPGERKTRLVTVEVPERLVSFIAGIKVVHEVKEIEDAEARN